MRELYKTLQKCKEGAYADHLQGIKNLRAERRKFFCTKPISDQESHYHWVTRLKNKGKECDFAQMDLNEAIKLVVTLYRHLPKLQTAIIRDDISLELAQLVVEYMKSKT